MNISLNGLEVVGMAILVGYITGSLVGKLKVPQVAGYVIIGVICGQSVLNIFTYNMLLDLKVISDIALGFIAFTIGGELHWKNLKKIKNSVFPIVIAEAFGAMILVTGAMWFISKNLPLSIMLGAISAATAPAATVTVIQESKAAGLFTSTLMAVVAIDDAIALIIYGIASTISKALLSVQESISLWPILALSFAEICGAIFLGGIAGLILVPFLKKMKERNSIFSVGGGMVLLIIGLCEHFNLSSLLANMTFGIVLVNITPHSSQKLFGVVDMLTPPIFIAFFVLAGAYLRLDLLPSLGVIGLVYLLTRTAGKISGASLGALIANAPDTVKKYIGFGLISQVGIAIGLSLVVAGEFSTLGEAGMQLSVTIINILLATTVVTEIMGPIMAKYALHKSGEVGQMDNQRRTMF